MKNRLWRIISALVISLIMILAFNFNPNNNLNININFIIGGLIIFLLINILLKKKISFKVWPFINALLFSIFIIVGKCFDGAGTILIIHSFKDAMEILLYLSGLTVGFYLILERIYQLIDDYKPNIKKESTPEIIQFIFEDHPFFMGLLMALLGSIFYLFFFYPGIFTFDGKWQLNAYFGFWERNDHHPFLLSSLMANLFLLGKSLLNDNLGIFFYILIQVIVNGLIYGYMAKIMKEINTPYFIRVIILLFYTFFPLWVINSITYIKDTIYYLIFLLIVVFQYYHLEVKKNANIKHFVFLAFLYIILYIWRNTGFYVGIISLTFLIFTHFKSRKIACSFTIILVSVLLVNTLYHKVYLPSQKVDEALPREKMSIFLQQTARYITMYSEDITNEEKNNLEALFKVDVNILKDVYNPNRSDDVKDKIYDYPTKEQLNSYFKAWFSMFKKHPLVYIDATLNNTYGYFYSQNKNFIGEEIGFYDISEPENYDVHFQARSQIPRKILKDFARKLCDNKISGLLYSPYFYTWILIILFLYHISKKHYKFLAYFVPLYLTLAICLISPVNGHMRYLQPIAITLPMMIVFTIYNNNKDNY